MERVLKHLWLKFAILLVILIGAQPALATSIVVPSDDDIIVSARAIIRAKVISVDTNLEGGAVFTYVTLRVQEVIKGQIAERRIVLKELGGVFEDKMTIVYGVPRYNKGDRVFLYLSTWSDGTLRTQGMLLGKFSIEQDHETGKDYVNRDLGGENVTILDRSNTGVSTDRMELSAYIEMVRNRLAVNWEAAQEFHNKYFSDTPFLSQPPGFSNRINSRGAGTKRGEMQPQFHLFNTARWFEPDTNQPVVFYTNPESAPNPQIFDDVSAAMNAWSTVPGCSLRVTNGGSTNGTGIFVLDGQNTISFNNGDGYFGPGSVGVLAVASIANISGSQTKVVNGTTFRRALESNISFNPYSASYFSNHCNVQEVTTHEMGHALGLAHAWDPNFPGSPTQTEFAATMYYIAHFDGRCASLRQDDINGITFIYPGSGGGGPLTITTATLSSGVLNQSYSQNVLASGGTTPYTWSLNTGSGPLPTGLSLNAASGAITGTPTATGTFNFTVKVTDSQSATATKALSITVNQASLPYSSQFVSQSGVPASVNPGQTFTVTMTWQNNGTQTWGGSLFYAVTQNPEGNFNWLGGQYNALILSGFSIPPGQQLSYTFDATAPTTPGTYNFQWQLYQNDGTTLFFGEKSANVVIQVGSSPPPPTDSAAFISQSVTSSMIAGQNVSVSVTMQNNGTTTWSSASGYKLSSQNPSDNMNWGMNRVNLPSSVAPGAQVTFTFNVTAPSSTGTYNFQWKMVKEGTGNFGVTSTNVAVAVSAANGDSDGDGMPNAVESQEGTNPLVKDNNVFTSARLFAMQQYRDYLGREGDSSGINFWTNQITSGALTRAQVIDSFFKSAEFQAITPVTRLYFAYFRRVPDYTGLLFWVNQFKGGMSLDTISQNFAGSAEFIQTYGSLNNSDFVTLVYQNVLGRAPDSGGFTFWVNQLNSGAQTRGQVMLNFSESAENKQTSANKVYVVQMYVGMLRRSPEQAGFDFWVNEMNQGSSGLNLIQDFLNSLEYHNRFLP